MMMSLSRDRSSAPSTSASQARSQHRAVLIDRRQLDHRFKVELRATVIAGTRRKRVNLFPAGLRTADAHDAEVEVAPGTTA